MFPLKKPPVANTAKSAIGFLSGAPKSAPSAPPAVDDNTDGADDPDQVAGDTDGAQDQHDVYQTVEQLVGQYGADEVKAALDACLAKHGSDQQATPHETGGGLVS